MSYDKSMLTPVVDRKGNRIRWYKRKLHKVSKYERAEARKQGKEWCVVCEEFLPEVEVYSGRCKPHRNQLYREMYAKGGKVAIAARVHARKRGIAPVTPEIREILIEQFAGKCLYCGNPATTYDHIIPVRHGGQTKMEYSSRMCKL